MRHVVCGFLIVLASGAPALAADDDAARACALIASRPADAEAWIKVSELLASGARVPCRGQLQRRFIGRELPDDPPSPPDPRLITGAAREALSLTWAHRVRERSLRVLVDVTRPRLVPCPPKVAAAHEVDCPILEGDPRGWSAYRALFIAETGEPPEGPGALMDAALAAGKVPGWVMPGTPSGKSCAPGKANRPLVEAPPPAGNGHCGEYGYRICPTQPGLTWIHVAETPCENDALVKTEYGDQNKDGIDEAFAWIKYDSFDGADVVGSRTHLHVLDGRTGVTLLHGVVAATVADPPDKGDFRMTVNHTSAGRLILKAPTKTNPSIETRIRRDNPLLLAPGTYVLGDYGFHRVDAPR